MCREYNKIQTQNSKLRCRKFEQKQKTLSTYVQKRCWEKLVGRVITTQGKQAQQNTIQQNKSILNHCNIIKIVNAYFNGPGRMTT